MRRRSLLLLAGLALASCAPQTVDTANYLPHYANGAPEITEDWALQLASYTLVDPVRLRGNPIDAARTIGAVDYFAGALQWNARWPYISNLTRALMVEARSEVRLTLGIRPDAKSQEVVDRLFGAADALAAHDDARARALLSSPIFTFGPDVTLARLSNLPYLPKANYAVQKAAQEAFGPCVMGPGCF